MFTDCEHIALRTRLRRALLVHATPARIHRGKSANHVTGYSGRLALPARTNASTRPSAVSSTVNPNT